jgi:MYXO-CTERM domain-containing protein
MKSDRTRLLFAFSAIAFVAAAGEAQAQCPPVAPTGVNAVIAPSLTVSEGAAISVSAAGGGPTFEWDTDCDGVTASRGDGVFGTTFVASAVDRDGTLGASFPLCVRSVNPTCPAAMRTSAPFRATIAVANADPTITTNALPNGAVGRAYSFRVQATDPANPPRASAARDVLTWSATNLPAGLMINSGTGEISGMPTAAGNFVVRLRVADGDGGIAIADVSMDVAMTASAMACPVPVLTTSGTITVDEGGIAALGARVNINPCRCSVGWDVGCDGTTEAFGASYTLSAAGRDGPATERLCIRSFAIGVTASNQCVGSSAELTVGGAAGIAVNNVAPSILTSSVPNGIVGSTYAIAVVASDPANPPIASGIQDAFTWSATGLPAGLSIDPATGVIFGTPTAAGSFMSTVTVRDDNGGTISRPIPIVIDSAAAMGTCPTATVVSPGPAGIVVAEGGANTVNSSIGGDACGCTIEWDLNCDSTVDGAGSSFNISGVNRDGASTFTLCHRTIPSMGGMCTTASARSTNTVNVSNVAPTVTTVSLPVGTLDVAYTAMLTASDPANPPLASMERDPITWSAIGLPPGLMLNASTGAITGTPDSMAGATERCYPLTITASDGDGGSTNRTLDLCLLSTAAMVCPTATTAGPFTATEGAIASLAVSFGAGGACGCEVAWDFNCDGIVDSTGTSTMFNTAGFDGPSTRAVCWVSRPTAGGMCNAASVRSTNALNVSNAAPTITTASIPGAMAGVAYSTTIAATDPANPPVASSVQDALVWSLMGAPAWLSIDAMTGAITGTPPAGSGGMSFPFTVSVTDGDMGTTTAMFTLAVMAEGMDAGPDAGPEPTVEAGVDDAEAGAVMDDAEASVGPDVRDTGVRDTGVRLDATADTGVATDASADGGMVSGDGSCACTVPGGPTQSNGGTSALIALAAVATVVASRRRARR